MVTPAAAPQAIVMASIRIKQILHRPLRNPTPLTLRPTKPWRHRAKRDVSPVTLPALSNSQFERAVLLKESPSGAPAGV